MITDLTVGIRLLALVFGVIRFWGQGIHRRDMFDATVFHVRVGHGMTIEAVALDPWVSVLGEENLVDGGTFPVGGS